MRGIVLTTDSRNGRGLLRAEDGRRYGFDLADWRDEGSPVKGDEVDFEIVAGAPREILLLRREQGGGVSPLVAFARRIRERPVLMWAGALCLASLLPTYGFAGRPGSLFAIQTHVSALAGEIDRLWAAAGTGPEVAARVGIAKALLGILPLTLAAPLLSALVFWRDLNEEETAGLASIAGMMAAILTAGIPLLAGFATWLLLAGLLDRGAGDILAAGPFSAGGLGVFRFFNIGAIAVSVSGFMLWRAANGGRIPRFPMPVFPGRSDPAAFAPDLSSRRLSPPPAEDGDDPIPAQFRRKAGAAASGPPDGTAIAPPAAAAEVPLLEDPAELLPSVTEALPEEMLPPVPVIPAPRGRDFSWPPPEVDAADGHAPQPVAEVPPVSTVQPAREIPRPLPEAIQEPAAEPQPETRPLAADAGPAVTTTEGAGSVMKLYERLRAERLRRLTEGRDEE